MDVQENEDEKYKPQMMEQEVPNTKEDIFEEFLLQENHNFTIYRENSQKSLHYRSTKNLIRRQNFRKILNTSSSNDKLIPSSIKNDSSRENSERDRNFIENENSFDQQSFRKTFKKKFEESFSIQHTIRDSSSSFSERSDSKSLQNIIPAVYKEEQMMSEEKKFGCNCKRSRCLKLYCQCFQKQLFCNQNCNCHSCGNLIENKQEHNKAVIEALARNAYGFEEDDQRENNPEYKSFRLGVEPGEVRKGCKCKKTKCVKKYCECYQSGLQCGVFCKCENCINIGNQNIKN